MRSFAISALMGIIASSAFAQHQTFSVNSDASEVKMTLRTTHELVNGRFHIQSGSIEFDRSARKMSGLVSVIAGSGKTGNDSRDKGRTLYDRVPEEWNGVTMGRKAGGSPGC